MKIAYLDCFNGISGDMLLGAFLDAGLKQNVLRNTVKALGLKNVSLKISRENRCGLQGTRFFVRGNTRPSSKFLKDILRLIEKSALNSFVKRNARDIFNDLANVEAGVHGLNRERVHFHEIGALDSIVDIVGACAAIESLGLDAVYASAVPVGSGFQKTMHGELPIPSPAVCELLKDVPVIIDHRLGELTTPTGAVLLKHFCKSYGPLPEMKIQKIGYGAGARHCDPLPNLLRVLIGEATWRGQNETDTIVILQTNIDDMNPQWMEHLFELLFDAGALDVYVKPIQMKKSRMGMELNVISALNHQQKFMQILFRETTSLGIRTMRMERSLLARKEVPLKTKYGIVPIKMSYDKSGLVNWTPEYEVLKKMAKKSGHPLKQIYFEVLSEARSKLI